MGYGKVSKNFDIAFHCQMKNYNLEVKRLSQGQTGRKSQDFLTLLQ